jgi:hypothetical protein
MGTAEMADNSGHELLSRECPFSPRNKTDSLTVAGNMSKSSGEAVKLNLHNCY